MFCLQLHRLISSFYRIGGSVSRAVEGGLNTGYRSVWLQSHVLAALTIVAPKFSYAKDTVKISSVIDENRTSTDFKCINTNIAYNFIYQYHKIGKHSLFLYILIKSYCR